MQWRMLGRRGRTAGWTVVGDVAQSSRTDREEAERSRETAFGRQPRRAFRLTTNYRNPAEVAELAAAVIRQVAPEADVPRAVRATGHPPRHVASEEPRRLRELVVELLAEVTGAVGVITASGRREQVAAALTGAGGDRVQVVAVADAKGMEYDGVLLVAPAEIVAESGGGVAQLYVALTRATQRLVTAGVDQSWIPAAALPLR